METATAKIFWLVLMTFGVEPDIELIDDFVGTYEECEQVAINMQIMKYEKNKLVTCLHMDDINE